MEEAIPNSTTTIFQLGSLTKQFTAMLLMQLVEKGLIELNQTVSHYLPDYPSDKGQKITIHHLLSHSSGIPDYTPLDTFYEWMTTSHIPSQFIDNFSSLDLEFEPGSEFRYSNSGYYLLGVIIEKVTGNPVQQVLKEFITEPLGMNNTGLADFKIPMDNMATGYEKLKGELKIARQVDCTLSFTAGGMYSTIDDLYIWDQALYTNSLLSKKYRDIMFRPNLSIYAYGWGVARRNKGSKKDLIISHGGGTFGYISSIVRLVKHRQTVILLSNIEDTDLQTITSSIIKILDK